MRCTLLLGAILVLFIIGTASTLQPASGNASTSGEIHSGDPVNMKRIIEFPSQGSEGTFPSGHDLEITTRLENPQWTYSLILEGIENPKKTVTAEKLVISGFELSYPATVKESVIVTLNGTAPEVSRVTMTSVMEIHEIDSSGQIAPNTSRSDSQLPIHPRVTATTAPVPATPIPAPTTQKGSPALIIVLSAIAGVCGVAHLLAARRPAAGRE